MCIVDAKGIARAGLGLGQDAPLCLLPGPETRAQGSPAAVFLTLTRLSGVGEGEVDWKPAHC